MAEHVFDLQKVSMAQSDLGMKMPAFEMIFWILGHMRIILPSVIVVIMSVRKSLRLPYIIVAVLIIPCLIAHGVWESHQIARQQGYDMSLPTIREMMENYIATGEGPHPLDVIESKKYPPAVGYYELRRFLGSLFMSILFHDVAQDQAFIPEGYNKGHDWFEATLGEPMFYSSGFYYELFNCSTTTACEYKESLHDGLNNAQLRKMQYITHALGAKPGMQLLDIGSGWGRFASYVAERIPSINVTGVVAASDLLAYAQRLNKKHGSNVNFIGKNFFEDLGFADKHFDVISAIEMSEHAGIINYQTFLRKVYRLLKDDGVFYIQCAGLQRGHAKGYNNYEELIWGAFMEESVFPGADSSTPLGWVASQLEQAGFEIQAVHNMGISYGRTLNAWRLVWEERKDEIVKVYGERSWRRWHVFASWCTDIARRGGSTVNFITVVKSGAFKARADAQARLSPGAWTPAPLGQLQPRHGDGTPLLSEQVVGDIYKEDSRQNLQQAGKST